MADLSGKIWSQVVGHERNIERLRNLIVQNKIPSSLMFVGPSGQGKRQVALGFAQTLVCEHSQVGSSGQAIKSIPLACGECGSCVRVARGTSESVVVLAPEKGVIKIEAVRAVLRQMALMAVRKARIFLIDEAHQLNPQAANALLKSVEEPPAGTHFILLGPSREVMMKTLVSRSQIVQFGALSLKQRLQLKPAESEPPAEEVQAWQWFSLLLHRQPDQLLEIFRAEKPDREAVSHMLGLWLEYVRDLWVHSRAPQGVLHVRNVEMYEKAPAVQQDELANWSLRLLSASEDIRGFVDVQLTLENLIAQLSRPLLPWTLENAQGDFAESPR